jgi:hypothetical protein
MFDRPFLLNLWAAPGVGKSSLRARLFNMMKARGDLVEEVTEFAKDLTYEENMRALADQFYVTAMQEHRCFRLIGKVNFIVTDSPIGMGPVYASSGVGTLRELIEAMRARYHNVDIYLRRDPKRPYRTYGRNQSEAESKALDLPILSEAIRFSRGKVYELQTSDDVHTNILQLFDREADIYGRP